LEWVEAASTPTLPPARVITMSTGKKKKRKNKKKNKKKNKHLTKVARDKGITMNQNHITTPRTPNLGRLCQQL
jgi:predicted DsbA family dithiol-disulfide isomerase